MSKHKISFQLYSARNFPPLETVLEGLAKIGYDAVEPYYPLYGDDAAGYRRKVDAVGLVTPTFHAPLDGVVGETSRFIDIAKTIGAEAIVIPYLVAEQRPTDVDGWKKLHDSFAGAAEKAKAAGLGLGYHNHDFEYVTLADGSRPIDHLIGNGVVSELDIGWVARAGKDAAAEIDKLADSTIAFHIKDLAPAGTAEEDGWADVGHGTIDWKALWPHIEKAKNAKILVAEHDNPADWKRFAERSFAAIKALVS
ncbi:MULTISPECIES: sugar phosphate isomerase/epimerase family protein [Kaistia]|uniref:Sugar phosphate isomerase/epimerase n=1 Tax=Kaistia nematophila TaxID=2994654 RepID=A0A9X3E4I0_9HYPH|nr:sugar phosphate isomerase/epimerase [Kaistia nematophila]MBN9025624.1 sugar phosphate isomerase/epimerase [Hyphomicrobiales bacterium]MCX5570983.1 sugar phosphate isomerase/epimerase [Kaistia nematophila]